MTQLPLCLRWREGRSTLIGPRHFDPARHGVAVITEAQARPFVERHHYSGSYPAARLAVGLFRVGVSRSGLLQRGLLVGVAVLSVPMQQRVIPSRLGVSPAAGVEIGRFVLVDDPEEGPNAESWFGARVLEIVPRELPGVRGVVSYSDPVQRRTASGEVVMPGHLGIIYQALSAVHVGRSSPRTLILDSAGRVLSERMLTKLRRGEQGRDYAERQLVACGAPRRQRGEEGAAYVRRALAEGPFRRVRHPGNLCYCWGVGTPGQRRQLRRHLGSGLPYPKGEAIITTEPSEGHHAET